MIGEATSSQAWAVFLAVPPSPSKRPSNNSFLFTNSCIVTLSSSSVKFGRRLFTVGSEAAAIVLFYAMQDTPSRHKLSTAMFTVVGAVIGYNFLKAGSNYAVIGCRHPSSWRDVGGVYDSRNLRRLYVLVNLVRVYVVSLVVGIS